MRLNNTSANPQFHLTSADDGISELKFGDQSDLTRAVILYRSGSAGDALCFNGYNNTERMRINSSGQVGLGTNAPAVKLDIVDDQSSGYIAKFKQGHTSNSAQILIDSPTDSGTRPALIELSRAGTLQWSFGQAYNDSNDSFHIATSTLQSGNTGARFTIKTDGKVGIASLAPTVALDVNGTTHLGSKKFIFRNDSGHFGIYESATDTTPNNELEVQSSAPQIRLEETSTGGSKRLDLFVTSSGQATIAANQSAQSLAFQTTNEQRVVITSTGRLGINTTAPDHLFEVMDGGASVATSRSGNNAQLLFKSNNVGQAGQLQINESSGGGVFIFSTKTTSGTLTESFRINTDQTISTNGAGQPNSSILNLAKDGTTLTCRSFATGGYDSVFFRSANTNVGKIHFNSGGTQYHTSSDYRRKENVVGLTSAITRLKTLKPYRFNFKVKKSKPVLPSIKITNSRNENDELTFQSNLGLKNRLENFILKDNDKKNVEKIKKKYADRLSHELSIIHKMNYSGYFLIVSDYIKWAKNNSIPVGPGRGSGAGSLVAYCLDITDLDPIEFDLIFERFLNPDRISMPDFDIDFCEEKRDQVFKYLTTKYKDSVAHIITFGKLKARMVIRDVGRVLGLPYGFIDSICKMIPFDPSRPLTLQESINVEPRLQKLINEDKRVSRLIELSLKLEGLNRNVATHAAGVVIADKKLTESVPLYKDSSADLLLPSTQFDMYSAENAGLVKFDFLGLKTLTVINNTQKLVEKNHPNFKIETINYEDQKVFDLLSSGKTVGLFQLESSGMKEALINMKPNHLEDIIALVALYRPGPMSNIPIYNDCKHGKREPDYLHPKLEEILKPTYGVIIYQEQVMQIAQVLSGFTAGEADILRRAMGKKKRAELEKQKERFVEGAHNNGISKDIAAGIFLKIEPFAEYGFNKSHAAAYAIIAYQTAFLKTYYPHEFFAASMSMELSNQKKLSEFYEELKRLGINIIRPDINKCYADFSSDGKNFLYALGAIKSVGFEAISKIVEERTKNGEFKDLTDFINRVNPKDINKSLIESAFQRLKEPLKDLNKRGVRIILIRDIPLLSSENSDITTCLMQEKFFGRNVCDVSHEQDSLTRTAQDTLYDKLANYLGIEIWDPRQYMLSNENMYKVDDANGNVMMMDLNHITKSYSELLSKYFRSDVLNIITTYETVSYTHLTLPTKA